MVYIFFIFFKKNNKDNIMIPVIYINIYTIIDYIKIILIFIYFFIYFHIINFK